MYENIEQRGIFLIRTPLKTLSEKKSHIQIYNTETEQVCKKIVFKIGDEMERKIAISEAIFYTIHNK